MRDGPWLPSDAAGQRTRVSVGQGALESKVSPTNLTTLDATLSRLLGARDRGTTLEEGALNGVYRGARSAPVLEPELVAGTVHAWSDRDAGGIYASSASLSATGGILDFLMAAR